MNPFPPPNTITGNTVMNPPQMGGVRPVPNANHPFNSPLRPMRMPQMQPNERINNSQQNYQQHQFQNLSQNQQIHSQQQQQQNNTFQNHPQPQQIDSHRNNFQQHQKNIPQNHPQQQQQINTPQINFQTQNNMPPTHPQQQFHQEKPGALYRQDSAKLQISPANKPNGPNQYNQGIPSESQRTQMMAPTQGSAPHQSIRPPFINPSSETPLNQSQSQNYKKMEAPRGSDDRVQFKEQNGNAENCMTATENINGMTKKSSEVNQNSFPTTQPKLNETTAKSQMQVQPGNGVDTQRADRKPDLKYPQATLSQLETKRDNPVAEGVEIKKSSEGNNQTQVKPGIKNREKNEKESNKNALKDNCINRGVVQKNIKFFEENDTAKKPLTPTAEGVKKRKRECESSRTVKKDSEGGVDESPMVHPNLGNIFQVPRKVAKVSKKHIRKHRSEKNKLKSSSALSKGLHGKKKWEKKKSFGSNEELLAFFESSKSWREFNSYDKSSADKNSTKDKLGYKPTTNGDITHKKTPSKLPAPSKINAPASPTKSPLKSPGTPGAKLMPKTPESTAPSTPLIKKVPMNKIQVGAAPSPNLKVVRSKVGSLANTTHKPGGGNVKIETHKIDLSKAQPRIEAKNEQYKPSGGDKKIAQVKLQWSAKSKIGSLENATYKPGGGDKKIESLKLDFKEKAKSKVGSKDNVKHVPGGGNIKIENQKLEFKAQSKVGSLDNVKHKPGGGDIKIFDDKTYLRQVSGNCSEGRASGTQSYKTFSTAYEVEGRSAPATPGRKTTVKIKKIIKVHSFEENPKVEKVTEVTVTSQTPKKEKNFPQSPIKQEVKVTYSKIASSKPGDEDSVEMIKVPAKNYAPILRPSLSKTDAFGNSGNDDGNQVLMRNERNKEMQNFSLESSGLQNGKSNLRDETGNLKFMQEGIIPLDKLGEKRREANTISSKSSTPGNRLHEDREAAQSFSSNYSKSDSTPSQFRSPNLDIQSGQSPQSLSFFHNEPVQINQPEYRVSSLQRNESMTGNRQFQ